jgi:hypothetical protein
LLLDSIPKNGERPAIITLAMKQAGKQSAGIIVPLLN